MTSGNPKEALKRAIEIVGGQTALAEAIGDDQPNVWYWLNKAKNIPAEKAGPISQATGGKVTKHQLRPDLFPAEKARARAS